MNGFWSLWIMFLVVLNLGITLFLFVWGTRVEIPTQPDGTSGHVWAHGVLRESVRKLPLWWVLMSAGMFVCGFAYLALYPGFGAYKGLLGWTSAGELRKDSDANAAKIAPLMQRIKESTVEQLAADPAATRLGQRLFIDNCAACHGREGHGNQKLGAPNLVDGDWLYGGDGGTIMSSILDGRHGAMPAFASAFGEDGVADLANYVLGLSNSRHDEAEAKAGKSLFTVCSACHGVDGKGNPALGAPNLTDRTWLYGGDLATIEQSIRNGRSGQMPAWRTRLGEDDARVIAAWVYAQTHTADAQ
ncbi:MAG: cytochrome-c oxidase, cbb3-type subunit III [Dokdonella sp.]